MRGGRDSPFHDLPWSVLLPALGLLVVGLLFVWSTTRHAADPLWTRQLAFVGAGTLAGLVVLKVGVRQLAELSWPVYLALGALLLAMPLVASSDSSGTVRWINLGFGFKLQPSEFVKLGLVFVLARHLQHRGVTNTWRSYTGPFLLTLVPFFLVMRQPDLGSALVLLPIFMAMVTVSGARVRHVVLLTVSALVLMPLAYFVPGVLREYQKERIDAFLRPIPALMADARELRQKRDHEAAQQVEAHISELKRGTGRQQYYSVVAIGSGGLLGAGLGDGLQNKGNRVPVRHADFIFCIVGEEWGLLGTTTVVALYALLVSGILGVAYRTREPFGRLVCVGVAAQLGGQALMNLGIASGMLPVTGVPLPLLSYGGSSLVATLLGLACVVDISRQRLTVFFES
ncbi:MAG TPA: FtsW/RodA/SpoVE family cell cycle protein [Planctomycetota bacterium]|jgi:rod shape determining protein RodA|nr:FtsW/RodA/SpoVE family cell cycle protein [Planctomycetota bacterium]